MGRGPRGYRRSDALIAEDAHRRLTDHPDLDAGAIEVRVHAGDVTLSGDVEDRDSKFLAEELVADIAGVGGVMNQLRVPRDRSRS